MVRHVLYAPLKSFKIKATAMPNVTRFVGSPITKDPLWRVLSSWIVMFALIFCFNILIFMCLMDEGERTISRKYLLESKFSLIRISLM